MNIKKLSLASATSLMMMGVMTVSALAVGSNGSFEVGTDPIVFAPLSAGSTNITDWTVGGNGVDYIGSYWQPSEGSRSIDLNNLDAGIISQDVTTVVGTSYDVKFDLSGNPDSRPVGDSLFSPSLKTVRVSATGGALTDYSYDTTVKGNSLSDMKWETGKTYTFIATNTTTTLIFASQIAGAFGPALDNVSITATPVVTPTPTLTPTPTPTPTATPTPTPVAGKDGCKNGGWKNISGLSFKNQGDCVSYYATMGRNQPAGN